MLKGILIIALVVAVLVGGLLTLRRSGSAGMPGDDVLKRASKRARQADADEQK